MVCCMFLTFLFVQSQAIIQLTQIQNARWILNFLSVNGDYFSISNVTTEQCLCRMMELKNLVRSISYQQNQQTCQLIFYNITTQLQIDTNSVIYVQNPALSLQTTISSETATYPRTDQLTTVSPACQENQTLITFDNLNLNSYTVVPNGYYNISWTNAGLIERGTYRTGYDTSIVSGNYTSYNYHSNPMTMRSANNTLITLYSAAVAAAWFDNLQLTVVGYRSNIIIVNRTYTLQVFTLSILRFVGYVRLDTIIFTTSGGIQNPNVTSSGTHYGMDNICFSLA